MEKIYNYISIRIFPRSVRDTWCRVSCWTSPELVDFHNRSVKARSENLSKVFTVTHSRPFSFSAKNCIIYSLSYKSTMIRKMSARQVFIVFVSMPLIGLHVKGNIKMILRDRPLSWPACARVVLNQTRLLHLTQDGLVTGAVQRAPVSSWTVK